MTDSSHNRRITASSVGSECDLAYVGGQVPEWRLAGSPKSLLDDVGGSMSCHPREMR